MLELHLGCEEQLARKSYEFDLEVEHEERRLGDEGEIDAFNGFVGFIFESDERVLIEVGLIIIILGTFLFALQRFLFDVVGDARVLVVVAHVHDSIVPDILDEDLHWKDVIGHL